MSADLRIRTVTLGLLAVLTAAAPAVVPLASGPASAAGVVETCQGQPATIVGTGPATTTGTEGPDVIVANGGDVQALGGDDLVCVRASTYVFAGEGDDSVTVEHDGPTAFTGVILGPGDDTYVGGPGRDEVTDYNRNGGDEGVGGPEPDSGDDDVTTGGGNDTVLVGGRTGPAQTDDVDLGDGSDTLLIGVVGTTATSRLRGGSGANMLLQYAPARRHVTLDLVRSQSLAGSDVLARGWTGFQSFDVETNLDRSGLDYEEPPRSVTVRGSAAAELVRVMATSFQSRVPVDVALGAGNDTLITSPAHVGRANGGDGRDRVVALGGGSRTSNEVVRLDLLRGRLSLLPGASMTLARFQDAAVVRSPSDGPAVVIGDNDDNRLGNCGTVRGGGGNDLIRIDDAGAGAPRPTRCQAFRVSGGPGSDRLIGSLGNDVLDGGTGRDVANGDAGVDTCRAEQRISCERR